MKIKIGLVLGISLLMTPWSVWAHGGIEHGDATETVEQVIPSVPLGLQGLKEMLSVHPVFVHFPIGLLFMSAVFYFAGTFLKKESLLQAGKWTLWSGALSAAAAVWTGLRAAYTVPHNDETHRIMLLHQNMGYAILAIAVILSAWLLTIKAPVPKRGRVAFLIALALLTLISIQQADLGGRMVFLYGTGVGKKSMLGQVQSKQLQTHESHEEMGH